jgi:hypothetical protein
MHIAPSLQFGITNQVTIERNVILKQLVEKDTPLAKAAQNSDLVSAKSDPDRPQMMIVEFSPHLLLDALNRRLEKRFRGLGTIVNWSVGKDQFRENGQITKETDVLEMNAFCPDMPSLQMKIARTPDLQKALLQEVLLPDHEKQWSHLFPLNQITNFVMQVETLRKLSLLEETRKKLNLQD